MGFKEYSGDLMGLYHNENHPTFRWSDESCKILFSVCRQGNAVSCHFASNKKGLRKLREAINEWIDFVFKTYTWCEMIIAYIELRSVRKIAEWFGFEFVDGFVPYNTGNPHDAYFLTKEKYYE